MLGLQFHLESTPQSVREIAEAGRQELAEASGDPYVQSIERLTAARPEEYDRCNRAMHGLLARLPQ